MKLTFRQVRSIRAALGFVSATDQKGLPTVPLRAEVKPRIARAMRALEPLFVESEEYRLGLIDEMSERDEAGERVIKQTGEQYSPVIKDSVTFELRWTEHLKKVAAEDLSLEPFALEDFKSTKAKDDYAIPPDIMSMLDVLLPLDRLK